ncbi:MAG: NAD(P)/FAD-dependent oxidoreductase, partial [Actinobacteria bacterium]|nr:NAD(P)/FAD-dependent oxidoreductase [Actinomycetota bacterium]
ERLLGVEEPFVGEEIKEAFEAEGITVLTNSELQSVRRSGGDGPVTATLQDGRELTGDEMLVAVGRKPRTEDIGLDVVGLEPGKPVPVDDRLAAEGVDGGWLFAVGDANGRSLLTHMGKYQARILADRILGVDRTAWADDRAVPRVIFTDPQVAAVGLNEASAKKKGLHVRTASSDVGSVSGGSVRGEGIKGTCQIVVDSVKGVIVGATFVGPEVGEMLQSATIAIVGEVPVERLWHAVPSFPTMSEVWLRMLEELLPARS